MAFQNVAVNFDKKRNSSLVALSLSLTSTMSFLAILASRSESIKFWAFISFILHIAIFAMFGSIVSLWISLMLHDHSFKTYAILGSPIAYFAMAALSAFIGPTLMPMFNKVPSPSYKTTSAIRYRKPQKKARKWFDEMMRNGCTPNVVTYTALIHGCLKARKVSNANELFEMMLKEGCMPNVITYTSLIDDLGKARQIEKACQIYARMRGWKARGRSRGVCQDVTAWIQPKVAYYGSLIDVLFKDKRLDLALKVLSKMLENFCVPNLVIYIEMIDGLCTVGKTNEAYKLLLKMQEKGCNPNVVTYTAMIDGVGKLGKIEMCLELLRDMCSKVCAPNFITYRVLIYHSCSTSLLDEAHRLLDEMNQTYWPKRISSYHKIVEGFSREFITSNTPKEMESKSILVDKISACIDLTYIQEN
ncbi:hypothetical protein K1719_018535 [Acacia pycnantha]|nr:hypothetical protein K1719_018535 [Acacia pycnantha]